MQGIIGVRFNEAGPLTYCSPGELDLAVGDYVVVRTDRGEQLGWVVIAPDQVIAAEPEGPLRVIDRLASEDDVGAWRAARERALEDIRRAQEIAARNDPRVRVANVEYNLAGTHCRVTSPRPSASSTAGSPRCAASSSLSRSRSSRSATATAGKSLGGRRRLRSRALLQELADRLPLYLDADGEGAGPPAQPDEDLPASAAALLCCLSYEVEEYRRLRGDLPKVGKRLTTPVGRARVISLNTLKGQIRMRLDETGEVIEMSSEELRAQYGSAVRPEELEQEVEEPIRRQDRERREAFVATLEPVRSAADPRRRTRAAHKGRTRGRERPEAPPPAWPPGRSATTRRRWRGRRLRRRRVRRIVGCLRRRRPSSTPGGSPPTSVTPSCASSTSPTTAPSTTPGTVHGAVYAHGYDDFTEDREFRALVPLPKRMAAPSDGSASPPRSGSSVRRGRARRGPLAPLGAPLLPLPAGPPRRRRRAGSPRRGCAAEQRGTLRHADRGRPP